jgi:putative oxidoreductase
MKLKVVIAARVLLGLVFFVFGLNGFLHLFALPEKEGVAAEFVGGLIASGYFFRCFFGRTPSRDSALGWPLRPARTGIVNIVAAHLFLDPLGVPSGLRSSSPGRAVRCSGRCCACEDVHL